MNQKEVAVTYLKTQKINKSHLSLINVGSHTEVYKTDRSMKDGDGCKIFEDKTVDYHIQSKYKQ